MNLTSIFQFEDMEGLSNQFKKDGFVHFDGLLPEKGLKILKRIYSRLQSHSMRKDFRMPQSNYSSRNLYVIGGGITNTDAELKALYLNPDLVNVLSTVASLKITECPDIVENIIFTTLSNNGDNHGWHVDDYPIAFILCIESPQMNYGGDVEFIDLQGVEQRIHLKKGDGYLMRSDLIKHRVAPLKRDGARRTILNFTYSTVGIKVRPNGSARMLCE